MPSMLTASHRVPPRPGRGQERGVDSVRVPIDRLASAPEDRRTRSWDAVADTHSCDHSATVKTPLERDAVGR